MLEVSCPLCGSNNYGLIFVAPADPVEKLGYFSVARCKECDFVFTNPQPEEKDLKELYSAEYYGEEHQRFWPVIEKVITFFRERRIKEIERFKKKGRILDIGCGRGRMLYMLKKRGWETYGTELSERSSRYAVEKLGLKIYQGEFMRSNFPPDFFDCITLWHVLEHLEDPLKNLMEIRRILKEDGLLLIAVPDFGGAQSVFSGKHWFHLDVPRHYSHFTVKTLTTFLDKSGFQFKEEKHFSLEYDPFGLLQSTYNLLGLKHNLLYSFFREKKRRKKLINHYSLSFLFILGSLPGFMFLSLALSVITSAIKKGGSLMLYCRKK
jgi:SAM-dependent methyltransferase